MLNGSIVVFFIFVCCVLQTSIAFVCKLYCAFIFNYSLIYCFNLLIIKVSSFKVVKIN